VVTSTRDNLFNHLNLYNMKRILGLFLGFGFMLSFGIVSDVKAGESLDFYEGHFSTGNQDWGGPNGRWELVCDSAHSAVCCVSHPTPPVD
jgi:hypothetical protein